MLTWMIDAFFWLVLPIAALEAVRIARQDLRRHGRSLRTSALFGLIEFAVLSLCAATGSPLLLAGLTAFRVLFSLLREGRLFGRRLIKVALVGSGLLLLQFAAGVHSLAEIATAEMPSLLRFSIFVLISSAPALTILPVHIVDEPRETLVTPVALVAFARVALPLGAAEPGYALVVPVVAAALSLLCALWLLSAGVRANQFEPATLVLEILVCERGVLLSFAWMGLASGNQLAEVGGLCQWWSAALALLALEGALNRRPLPKPMAFFALAMAVGLPGTIGFIAEDLLAQGLLELRPFVAAAFIGVTAIHAAALYLALVNLMVDVQTGEQQRGLRLTPPRPSLWMLFAAMLAVLVGLLPAKFVDLATRAHGAITHQHPEQQQRSPGQEPHQPR